MLISYLANSTLTPKQKHQISNDYVSVRALVRTSLSAACLVHNSTLGEQDKGSKGERNNLNKIRKSST